MLSLGKVFLLCLQPSKSSVHAPLLWSRQLDLSGTVLTQFLYLHWHHWHTSMCSHIPLSRRSSGVLTLVVSYPDFGTTLKIDFSGDACVPSSRRAPQLESCRKRTSAKRSPVAAFTSSWPANPRSLCLGPRRHHYLQPPHGREISTVFTHHHLHLVALSRVPLSSFPPSCARHCAFHASASFDAAGKSLPRWRLALASVGIFHVHFSRGIFAARSLHPVVCMQHSFFLWILTGQCGA